MRLSDPTMDYADSPDIVAGAGELLLATWMERVPTDPATYDFQIVVARSEDDGITWERSVVHRLHNASASNASYNNPSIGVDSLGRAHVAWLHSPDQQAATANVLFSLSPDGGSHWTQPRVLNRPQNEASGSAAPALTVDFGGKVVVAWEDFQDTSAPQIYATGHPADRYISDGGYSRIFDANGVAAWGNITWTATTTPGTGLSLATRAMTSAAVGWTNWVTHTTSGEAILHPTSRFIQYRAVFTSTGSETSVMDEVVITYEQHTIFLPLVFTDS